MAHADDRLLTVQELANVLGYSVQTIRNRLCTRPHTLPPRVCLPGALRWRQSDVQAWIADLPRLDPQPVEGRRRGRTRKLGL